MPSVERSEADTDSSGFILSVADHELNYSEMMISRSSG